MIIKNISLPSLMPYYYAGSNGKIYRLSKDLQLIELSEVFPNPKYKVKHVNLKFICDRRKVTRTIPVHHLIAKSFLGDYHLQEYKVKFIGDVRDTRPANLKWQIRKEN